VLDEAEQWPEYKAALLKLLDRFLSRPDGKRIAIKECSPAERVDDPAVGLVAISGGVDRQTLELLDRDDESDGFVRRWRRMRNMGAL
jgi:hypothetical protein